MRFAGSAAAIAMGLFLMGTARAFAASAPTVVEGVDVVAPAPLRSPPSHVQIENFVGQIGTLSPDGQLARWSGTGLLTGAATPEGQAAGFLAGETVCPQVLGLPQANADFIVARLRQVGKALGAPVSDRPCTALENNLVMVFPTDAAAFVQKLAEEKPQAFGFRWHGQLVQDLRRPPEPIRAWYGVQTVTTERTASRLATPRESVIFQVLIVVDRDKTDGLDMGQLSDYLSMISLADIRTEKVPPGASSILNVFRDVAAGRKPASGMTRLDAAYLQALYAVGPRQPGDHQNEEIANRVHALLHRR
jgi:hypothetical protein